MKSQIRVLGIDDAPFSFGDKKTLVVGVVMRIPSYMEAVIRTEVTVDGTDACDRLVEMISNSRYKEQLKLIMLDGVAFGGFNIIDIKKLYESVDIPIVTITRDEPDLPAMEMALKKHFPDWERRLSVITKGELVELETEHKPIFVKSRGMELDELKKIIKQATVRGALPEALRVAHLIAAGVVAGESRGRA
jgi:endonuclease V-like protein UPF0215 family